MNSQKNRKKVSSFPVGMNGIVSILCAIFTASAVMAHAAGYSIADLITPEYESGGSSSGRNAASYAFHFGNNKVVNPARLGGYGGAFSVNRSGYAAGYPFPGDNTARYTIIFGDDVVKNPGAPAGTYGDSGRVGFFNHVAPADSNSFISPASGCYPYLVQGSNNVEPADDHKKVKKPIYYYYIPGPLPTPIIIPGPGPLPAPTPTPIPAALPLFGSGLALLWLLHRRRGKSG